MYTVDHFTVVCLVAWPSNEGKAGVDLVFVESFPIFSWAKATLLAEVSL